MELKIMKASLVALAVVLAIMVVSPAFAHKTGTNHHHRAHHPKLSKQEVRKLNHTHQKHHRHTHPKPEPKPEPPNTRITTGDKHSVRVGTEVRFAFYAAIGPNGWDPTPADYFQCRAWGYDSGVSWDVAHGKGVPWGPCKWGNVHTYVVSDHYYQSFEVRAVDHAGNVDPTPAFDNFNTYNW
jgi:hypothetical protein